jgi:hypothetical protein
MKKALASTILYPQHDVKLPLQFSNMHASAHLSWRFLYESAVPILPSPAYQDHGLTADRCADPASPYSQDASPPLVRMK